MSQQLVEAIADMREEEALELVSEMVESGSEPMAILDATREAMDLVGQRYDEGTYYLPELVLAGEMLNQIMDLVKPQLGRHLVGGRILVVVMRRACHSPLTAFDLLYCFLQVIDGV